MQLTTKQAKALGLLDENSPVEAPRKPVARRKGGAAIPRAGRAEKTGLSTLILAGWSVQSPDSIRYRLHVLGQPALDTGLCADELAACIAAKALEKTR
jgi:hypothetical protein